MVKALLLYMQSDAFRNTVAKLELLLEDGVDADAIRGAAELACHRYETSPFNEKVPA